MVNCAILLFLFNVYIVFADTIDNGLIGEPYVQCGSESLSIRFKTQSAFEGHAYVKGHYNAKKCRTDATLESSVNLTVPYTDCDVVRQRSNNPRGIMITTTIIVSFHPMFITKIDKSYKVQCFYAEVAKTVTQQLDVNVASNMEKSVLVVIGDEEPQSNASSLAQNDAFARNPAEERFTYNVPLPECKYQVLTDSKSGEPVKFATVGQTVYHEWSCEPANKTEKSPFCATVHSCSVKDETGKEVQLFDENGCAVDRFLINNLEYTSELTGGQLSQVFKFADQPSVFFQCQIRLSLKEENGVCKRSSDNCPATLRGKRSVKSDENEVDVLSQKMTIFDIDEQIDSSQGRRWEGGKPISSDVCIAPGTASGLIALFASMLLVSLISACLMCFRHQTVNVKLAS
ncbi:unnamed protein product [Caenorhabditis auriculariae]|uniref:ZP domain-containing protein n=1 Tax=Caenorhabditis auriculariae TaxID=2777116 RepID=A0A8S1H0S8_9PELO|nr:unnamed protein product [Caenorhabditis auriculariae]